MSRYKKIVFLLFLVIFLQVLKKQARADLYLPPESSPCYKNEVFTNSWGEEFSRGCLNFPFCEQGVKKIQTEINDLRKICDNKNNNKCFIEKGGYCLQVNYYCSIANCVPNEKIFAMSKDPFYSSSPFFNKERTFFSPAYKIFIDLGGYEGIFKIVTINFIINFIVVFLILLFFKIITLLPTLKVKPWFILKIVVISLLGFITDITVLHLFNTNLASHLFRFWTFYIDILPYLVIFLPIFLLSYFLIFKPIEFSKRRFSIVASFIFALISNPFWIKFIIFLLTEQGNAFRLK